MSRIDESRPLEKDPKLAQALEREQLGRRHERTRRLVNCTTSSVVANCVFNSGNQSPPMSAFHGISRCDGLNVQPTSSSYSKLSEVCSGCFDFKHLALHERLASEDPLVIQCGENTALMYVSKLCQGSKGPCILFQDEWLTPNELQFISGRETAKDWKRSIRYKGRSLKSLISRGLLRVHPPICDCSGCRISLPLNRGRLTDKCGLSASLKNTKDTPRSVSSWRDKQIRSYRQISSDIKHSGSGPTPDARVDQRRDFNSTSQSECSDNSADEGALHYEDNRRHRILTPPTMVSVGARKRRSTDSSSLFYQEQDKLRFDGIGRKFPKQQAIDLYIHSNSGAGFPVEGDTCDQAFCQSDTTAEPESTSAFRVVRKDLSPPFTSPKSAADFPTCTSTGTLQREGLMRTLKTHLTNRSIFFPSQYSQCLTPPTLGQTPTRLLGDSYILPSHASRIYQRARIQSLPQSYTHYGQMAPMYQNLTQPFHSSVMLPGSGARAWVVSSTPPETPSPCGSPASRESGMEDKDAIKAEAKQKVEGISADNVYSQARVRAADESDHESTTHNSQRSSPSLSENPNSLVALKPPLQKRVSRLHEDLDENVLAWNTDDVCHFVLSITRSVDISKAFREENIDGHSLVLIREGHLLDRMCVKLGPAMKILAQINKLVANIEID